MRVLLACLFVAAPAFGTRLVATSPQTAEMLFQLGAGSHVVGVAAGSQYPPEAAKLPAVGQLFTPSLEKTLALQPNWVVLDTHTLNPAFEAALRSRNIPVFVWDTLSPETLLTDSVRFVAQIGLGSLTEVRHWQSCLEELKATPVTPVSYLGFAWQEPPIILGHGAFLSRLLALLGKRNSLPPHFHSPYVPVSAEWLVKEQVDEIFYLKHFSEPPPTAFAFWWPGRIPRTFALKADDFARASLTPFRHLSELPGAERIPRSCRAL